MPDCAQADNTIKEERQMFIKEFVKKYNLHDSLLESIEINKVYKTVKLTVDYCYWQQADYCEGQTETGIVHIFFSGVSDIIFDGHTLNSDEIVSCSCQQENTFVLKMKSDITGCYHIIMITADSVEMADLEMPKRIDKDAVS